MHGRVKVRTSEEQQLLKQKEQQKKLIAYRLGMKQILQSRKPDSYDPECLGICAQLLIINPDIYTLWNYRKEVVLLEIKTSNKDEDGEEKLCTFLENELKLTEQCLLANPKSYSSWHHRYWVLVHHPKANWKKEFDLCTKYLSMDDRNFHCWDYRRLILNKVGISLEDEIKFSTDRININFSNYSSWHYRSTILNQENLHDELKLVQNALFTDPADSSAWFYLRWVLSHSNVLKEDKEELLGSLEQLLELEPNCKWIVIAKCWLMKNIYENTDNSIQNQVNCYTRLKELDKMREGYYLDCQKTVVDDSETKE
ncbi:hypothetical protein ILUMI_01510 [Ignelater luminosus]|uniref:Geranylgeranyl transferase type-2 subunit alpha n=1 Tax=Ignelater luminosus TaxID=2038154 RepID=A0A8K0DK58_IGNLU|nr:hypothetical protein ILUMI_01510 [Ignelater luminosus]